jgi:hypothetical protein
MIPQQTQFDRETSGAFVWAFLHSFSHIDPSSYLYLTIPFSLLLMVQIQAMHWDEWAANELRRCVLGPCLRASGLSKALDVARRGDALAVLEAPKPG